MVYLIVSPVKHNRAIVTLTIIHNNNNNNTHYNSAPAGGECQQKQETATGLPYQNIRGQSRGSVAVQGQTSSNGKPAPLLRSRTLPAIVAPGLNILQAQIDARYARKWYLSRRSRVILYTYYKFVSVSCILYRYGF